MPAPTPSVSIYRGQAKSGIGEGPSIPVAHGEQYLEGTAEAFRDDDILRELRPWLTLDSDSADQQDLQDQLEGWSSFSTADWLVVARLASAGLYDRRAAYFSHARAWPLEQCLEGFDPGVYLGCSEVFDTGEAYTGGTDAELDKLSPEGVVKRWLPTLQANAALASAFLGHLLQAMETGYPLLIAAPVTAFTPGSDLFVLVSFARAALPADLKSRCTIRLYTRQPERFALHLGASLIVLPEDSAAEAMLAQGKATLLDHQGKLLKTSYPLKPAAQAYAQVAVAGAMNAPQGLLPFSAYIGKLRTRGLNAGGNLALLQLSYLLAMALAGDEADRAEMFRFIMRKQSPGLPWDKLLDEHDWARFPASVLAELVLSPANAMKSQGELELQGIVASVMDHLGLTLDEALKDWWQSANPSKLGRLAELLSQATGLFADPNSLAEQTSRIPLADWQQAGPALHGLLKLEMDTHTLARRSREQEALAELAKIPVNYAILAAATKADLLGPGWADCFIRLAKGEESGILLRMARDWLKTPADLALWQGLPLRLVDKLRRLQTSLPADLTARIVDLGLALDPAKDLDVYLRLADLLASASPDGGGLSDNPLLNALGINKLLDCLKLAGPRLDKASIQRVYACVSPQWRQEPSKTTTALIQTGAWLGWRREAGPTLTEKERRLAAWVWLGSPVWHDSAPPEACLESWKQAIEDLQPTLSGEEIQGLRLGNDRQGAASWPWITRFQEEQLADIARLAKDLGVLAEMAEAVNQTCQAENPADPIRAAFAAFKETTGADLPESVGPDALLWLMTPPQALPLDLEASAYLFAHAGHRQTQAYRARIQSVLAAFDTQPREALEAMETPNLWQERLFIDPWAQWLGSLQASADFYAHLDLFLLSTPKRLPFQFSPERVAAAERLRNNGYREIAFCLNPEQRSDTNPSIAYSKAKAENLPGLPGKLLEALLSHRSEDTAWKDIATGVFPEDGHPFIELVQYNDILGFLHQTRKDNVLQEAISKNPALLKPFAAPNPRLPVFELYASLHGEGSIATAINAFVRFVYNHHSTYQHDPQWWLALLESIEGRCRNQPGNHSEMALTTLCRAANNNIERKTDQEKHRLSLEINQALYKALVAKGQKDKARLLISE